MTIISSLTQTAFKTATGVFGGVWGYVAIAAVSASVAGYGAAHVAHAFDLAKYQALELRDAKGVTASLEAQAAALTAVATQQHALDTEVSQGAVAEAKAQKKLVTQTIMLTKEIPIYVHDAPRPTGDPVPLACIPYGFVRVLDASALSTGIRPVSPADLTLPPGQSDDTCAPVSATDLAQSIATNYGIAQQNAEQLDALEAKITEILDTANKHD